MELTELKLKLLLKKVEMQKRMDELGEDNGEEFADLSYKFTFLLGVLSGLDMVMVSGEMAKELFSLFDNENGKEKFVEKIYKE